METDGGELGGAVVGAAVGAEQASHWSHGDYVALTWADHVWQECFHGLQEYE